MVEEKEIEGIAIIEADVFHDERGYFMEFTLSNNDTTPVELFSVGSSVMKSFP